MSSVSRPVSVMVMVTVLLIGWMVLPYLGSLSRNRGTENPSGRGSWSSPYGFFVFLTRIPWMEKNSVCTAADSSEIALGGRHSTPRFG